MKHVTHVSKESRPASAIIEVNVTTKSGCKDVVSPGVVSACKETVKAGRIYSYFIL